MLMHMILGRFDYETVREAFSIYLENSSDMPKPADIVKIIEPLKVKRKWCVATFKDIKRRTREGEFIMDHEKQYVEDFLAAQTKAPEDERLMIGQAIKQEAIEHKKYWNSD